MVDIQTHKQTILNELQEEVMNIQLPERTTECMICLQDVSCIRIHCSVSICLECFPRYFVNYDYQLKCLICGKFDEYENVFPTQAFIKSLYQLDSTSEMMKNIDFQICTCGSYAINETMYSKQQCSSCKRWLCFFCDSDWDESKGMKNQLYTCTQNCLYETKLLYKLVPLSMNLEVQVSNRRCCPKCYYTGDYEVGKCKYHSCKCGHQFCFICLETEEDCKTKYKSAYNRPCAAIKKQEYTHFPRICKSE
ncbi:unnamed protein product [Didymodactylos carnosus]|uniref:RING-type domain-containing protein n=1 Tax=Didymodactylos carnosus TaxID=1234261 RepID=A0A815FF21_9BILA|nr:unnamed protein product [Didymodactylos carnosus]CAF4174476.1 unnamed protein product [Didymodactylos carnosus]